MRFTLQRGGWKCIAAACLIFNAASAHADGNAPALTAAALTHWLEGYREAWQTRNPERAAGLFTEDATYQETPYDTPFAGAKGVHDYWADVTRDQRNVRFDFQVLAVTGRTGIAHWSAKFDSAPTGAPVGLDGIFVLDFAADGRCSRLREWWHLEPAK